MHCPVGFSGVLRHGAVELSAPVTYIPALRLQPYGPYQVSVTEGNSGTVATEFSAVLSAPSSQTITVEYRTVDGTARAGEDYLEGTGTLTFPAGSRTGSFSIAVMGDTLQEPSESFGVELLNAVSAHVSPEGSAAVRIFNDDAIPQLSIADVRISETSSPVPENPNFTRTSFTVSLDGPSLDPVSVWVYTPRTISTGRSAYLLETIYLTFPSGSVSETGTLLIANDAVAEADQEIVVALRDPSNATINDASAVVTVVDDDSWAVQVGDLQIIEGNEGQALARVPVSITPMVASPRDQVITVNFASEDRTAAAGSDYLAVTGTLSLSPQETTRWIDLPIIGDTALEADETLALILSNALGASILDGEGLVTVANDDFPSLRISDAARAEGHGGTSTLQFTVTLSAPRDTAVSVQYGTLDGTAVAPADFTASSGTIVFAPGETSKTLDILVVGDTALEADETFIVRLSDPNGATIADTEGVGSIINDDVLPGEGVTIASDRKTATWRDLDGDLATVHSSLPILDATDFLFEMAGSAGGVRLLSLDLRGDGAAARRASLSFDAASPEGSTGDGKVDIGAINATGIDLGNVTNIAGGLLTIAAGDANAATPGLRSLTIASMGQASPVDGDLRSEIVGKFGTLLVIGDVGNASIHVLRGSIGDVDIGGDFTGSEPSASTGLFVDKRASSIHLGGSLVNATIALGGRTAPPNSAAASVLKSLDVVGDVRGSQILAGYDSSLAARHPDVALGVVSVGGDWIASDLAAGASAGPDGFFGTIDDQVIPGPHHLVSRIAKITIGGAVDGTAPGDNASDHFGFVAGRIGTCTVGGFSLFLAGHARDVRVLGTTGDVELREIG